MFYFIYLWLLVRVLLRSQRIYPIFNFRIEGLMDRDVNKLNFLSSTRRILEFALQLIEFEYHSTRLELFACLIKFYYFINRVELELSSSIIIY